MMIETLYIEYIDGNEGLKSQHSEELRKVSGMMDDKLNAGELTIEDLADYEEVASRAAFYAGFKAAMSIFSEMGFMVKKSA